MVEVAALAAENRNIVVTMSDFLGECSFEGTVISDRFVRFDHF